MNLKTNGFKMNVSKASVLLTQTYGSQGYSPAPSPDPAQVGL